MWPGRDNGGPRCRRDQTTSRWSSSDAHRSPGRLLLHHGLLDAGVNPDLRDLDDGGIHREGATGADRVATLC
jgi:hypothetical protein